MRHVDGRLVLLTEAALLVFDAEHDRETHERAWTAARRRWLALARSVGAPAIRRERLGGAAISEAAVDASRTLYLRAVEAAVRKARVAQRWDDVALLRRRQAAELYAAAGSPVPPPDEIVALHREGMTALLRSLATIVPDGELVGSGCCHACSVDSGKVFRIAAELREPRLPHDGCPRGLCSCDWWPAEAEPKRRRRNRTPRSPARPSDNGPADPAHADAGLSGFTAEAPSATRAAAVAVRRLAVGAIVICLASACGNPVATPTASASASPAISPSVSPSMSPGPTAEPPSPTPVPSQDLPSLYTAIEDQVIAIRGLPAKQRLTPTVLDETQLKARLTEQFQKENPPARVAASETTLKALGLLPPGASLEQLNLDLLTSQVAGYYDPDVKQLFVVSRSGQIGTIEEITFAHEFDHALQDQNFGLKGLGLDQLGQGDQSLARLSLAEGDATLLMSYWALRNLTPTQIGDLAKVDPQSQATLDAMPEILRDTLLFPYTSGLAFVQGLFVKGGWSAIDAVYAHPPDSTEQVLHPDKYAAGEKPVPVSLDGTGLAAKMGAGWSVAEADTLGEFQLRSWLSARGLAAAAAANPDLPSPSVAAAGWGGDRYVTLAGPKGTWAVEIVTTWDTATDASEFAAAAQVATRGLAGASAIVAQAGGPRITVLVAIDAATMARLRVASGS